MRSDGGNGPAIPGESRSAGTTTTGAGGFGSRRIRWSSKRMIQASFCSQVTGGGATATGAGGTVAQLADRSATPHAKCLTLNDKRSDRSTGSFWIVEREFRM